MAIAPAIVHSFDKEPDPNFPLNSTNNLDTLHKWTIKTLFLDPKPMLIIKVIFFLVIIVLSIFTPKASIITKEPSWVLWILLILIHLDSLTGVIVIIRRELANISFIEEALSPHQYKSEALYEEYRTRFAFHNITKDVRNLKSYISILKHEEPQLVPKFDTLDELTDMVEDTLNKFKNSETIRSKNPFLVHELFDNFLILNKPDLVREGSELLIEYQQPDFKELEIHQIFYEVYQVLNNLIDNARKAIAQTERKEIQILTILKEEGFVYFQVSDAGVGIEDKARNRIFDIGYSTTKGDGLGLLFVQTTLKRFGGEIHLLSSAVSGFSTTFEVKIPTQATKP